MFKQLDLRQVFRGLIAACGIFDSRCTFFNPIETKRAGGEFHAVSDTSHRQCIRSTGDLGQTIDFGRKSGWVWNQFDGSHVVVRFGQFGQRDGITKTQKSTSLDERTIGLFFVPCIGPDPKRSKMDMFLFIFLHRDVDFGSDMPGFAALG